MKARGVWALSPAQRRFVRFLVAGVANTLFGFAMYSALVVIGLPVWAALLLAHVAGVFFNFATAGLYVFKSSLRGRLLRYVACYGAVYLVNLGAISLVGQWVPSKIQAQAWLTLPMAVLSYLAINRFVFHGARASVQPPPAPRRDRMRE